MKVSPLVKASFELLGLPPGAAPADLKKSFHRLALLYHPDRNPSPTAAAEFQKVREAFELVSDPLRVAELNRKHLRERMHRPVVEGLTITFGSFFGYRLFDPSAGKIGSALRIAGRGTETSFYGQNADDSFGPLEENNSVLDNAAYDAVEAVYAGRFNLQDEERLRGETQAQKLNQLPWVLLNNQGILKFFEGDIKGAKKCYADLNARVPNNILFMYRLGLCEIIEAFQKPRRTLLGVLKPDRMKIQKGVELLRHCIKLGEERTVGRQKCLVIRKALADVLEKMGESRKAKALWRSVYDEDRSCAEAALRVDGREAALNLIKKKSKHARTKADFKKEIDPSRSLPSADV